MSQNNIRTLLRDNPIVPVVKIDHLKEVIPLLDYLKEHHFNSIEITLRTDCAMDAIRLAKEHCDDSFLVGAGSVIKTEQIKELLDLGIDFIVLPGMQKDLIEVLEEMKIPFLPGVMTPSEIMEALRMGWDTLKFFPAHIAGGMEALKTYSQVFPKVKFCPTGGISVENHKDFLALDNVLSVGGSWVQKKFNNKL
jgi:2-dehydro-3-deoxyphosphogluconate aldolase / (4S)-4-hydroxy-2-oxoglutarate aldolase